MTSPASPRLIIGTAGHIDHGKSSLVRALTGVDPDRLPEERARGMTIDLGFAHTQHDGVDLYFVDVPGHERFIRNMVAGAAGIDVALLIVAANEGLMPQTREHAHLLSLLGVSRCVVVVTKADLAPAEQIELARDEAETLLRSLEVAPIAAISTSAQSGAGVNDLLQLLASEAVRVAEGGGARPTYRWFRMPIDRAFSVAGRGTVVTGTVWHGDVEPGDELDLLPCGQRVRVRELQTHQNALSQSIGRRRLAINLPGVEVADAGRGCELATPGYLQARTELLVRLSDFVVLGRKPISRARVRLHIATTECLAEVRLFAPLAPGRRSDVLARAIVSEPIVAAYGQRFVLRTESATQTLGGGAIIHPAPPPRTRTRARVATGGTTCDEFASTLFAELGSADISRRTSAAIRIADWRPIEAAYLSTIVGAADAIAMESLIREREHVGEIVRLNDGGHSLLVHAAALSQLGESVASRLKRFVTEHPRAGGLPSGDLAKWLPANCPARFRAEVVRRLLASGAIVERADRLLPGGVSESDESLQLSPADRELYDALLKSYRAAGLAPPGFAMLPLRTDKNAQRLFELASLAVSRGELILLDGELAPAPKAAARALTGASGISRLASGQRGGDPPIGALLLHRETWEAAIQKVRTAIAERGPLLIAEIRDVLGSSRKIVVPLMERMDEGKITKRVADRRALA